MEGVAAAHDDAVGFVDSLHLIVEMMNGSEILKAELGAEHVPDFRLVCIITLRVHHAADIDAGKRHEDDAAVLINMVLQAEKLDLGRGPSQIILAEIGGIADQ